VYNKSRGACLKIQQRARVKSGFAPSLSGIKGKAAEKISLKSNPSVSLWMRIRTGLQLKKKQRWSQIATTCLQSNFHRHFSEHIFVILELP